MKESLNKLLKNKFIEPIIFVTIVGLLCEFVVFPGLTVADTIINLLTLAFSIFLLVFGYFYITSFFDKKEVENVIEPGETEFDYIPKEDMVKKKRTTKKKPEPHVVHPKVNKTKKK